jgi:hypothetical protein
VGTSTIACRDADEPTAPNVRRDRQRLGIRSGIGVTLDRQGVPSTGITTNATTYVNSRRPIANITIAAEADTGNTTWR